MKARLVAALAMVTLSLLALAVAGCQSSASLSPEQQVQPTPESKPASLTLDPAVGQSLTRGPYTFTLDSVEIQAPDASSDSFLGPVMRRPGDEESLASPGSRFVVIRLAITGDSPEANPQDMGWYSDQTPRLRVNDAVLSHVHGATGGAPGGPMYLIYEFEVPEDAESVDFELPTSLPGEPLTFRIR